MKHLTIGIILMTTNFYHAALNTRCLHNGDDSYQINSTAKIIFPSESFQITIYLNYSSRLAFPIVLKEGNIYHSSKHSAYKKWYNLLRLKNSTVQTTDGTSSSTIIAETNDSKTFMLNLWEPFNNTEDCLSLNLIFIVYNNTDCCQQQTTNLLISPNVGEAISFPLIILPKIHKPDLKITKSIQVTSEWLLTKLQVTNNSSFDARDIEITYSCPGMEVYVQKTNRLLKFPLKNSHGQFKSKRISLNVGEMEILLYSAKFDPFQKVSSCKHMTTVEWSSSQEHSPVFEYTDPDPVLVEKNVIYNEMVLPNHGFIAIGAVLGIFIGSIIGVFIVLYVKRKMQYRYSEKLNMYADNEMMITTEHDIYTLLAQLPEDNSTKQPKKPFLGKNTLLSLNSSMLVDFHNLWCSSLKCIVQSIQSKKLVSEDQKLNFFKKVDGFSEVLLKHSTDQLDLVSELLYVYESGTELLHNFLRTIASPPKEKKKKKTQPQTREYSDELDEMFTLLLEKCVYEGLQLTDAVAVKETYYNACQTLLSATLKESLVILTKWLNNYASKQIETIKRKRMLESDTCSKFKNMLSKEIHLLAQCFQQETMPFLDRFKLQSYSNEQDVLIEEYKKQSALGHTLKCYSQKEYLSVVNASVERRNQLYISVEKFSLDSHKATLENYNTLISYVNNAINVFVTRISAYSDALYESSTHHTKVKVVDTEDSESILDVQSLARNYLTDVVKSLAHQTTVMLNKLHAECQNFDKIFDSIDGDEVCHRTINTRELISKNQISFRCTLQSSPPLPWVNIPTVLQNAKKMCLHNVIQQYTNRKDLNIEDFMVEITTSENNYIWLETAYAAMFSKLEIYVQNVKNDLQATKEKCNFEEFLSGVQVNKSLENELYIEETVEKCLRRITISTLSSLNENTNVVNGYKKRIMLILENQPKENQVENVIRDTISKAVSLYSNWCSLLSSERSNDTFLNALAFNASEMSELLYSIGTKHQMKEDTVILLKKITTEHLKLLRELHLNDIFDESKLNDLLKELINVAPYRKSTSLQQSAFGAQDGRWINLQ